MESLCYDKLREFDGGATVSEFDAALLRALDDMRRFPENGTKRTISLEVSLTPESERGQLVGVLTEAKVQGKTPPVHSRTVSMGIDAKKGAMVFNPMARDDHRQQTLNLSRPTNEQE